jgi:hypothetical protein
MAADATVDVLPRAVVRRLLVGRWDDNQRAAIPGIIEGIAAVSGGYGISLARNVIIRERFDRTLRENAGLIRLGISATGDLSAEPAADLDPGEERNILRDVLFPPTPEADVRHFLAPLVRPFDWLTVGGDAHKKIPEDLASQYANLVSQGLSQRDIAKEIRPYLDGSRMRAARFARTFGMHVAHGAQLAADDGLGDLLMGYQIRAVKDEHTRSWHAHRDGTIYYKNPHGNQLGFDRMPRPPLESPDPRDRPAGASEIAFNCRCYVVPVLSPLEELEQHPAFTTAADKLVPDPATYADWFAKAPERERRLAVGSRRYRTVQAKVANPEWHHFVDPDKGTLVPVQTLKREPSVKRAERVQKVQRVIAQRREDVRRVSTFGFEPTAPFGAVEKREIPVVSTKATAKHGTITTPRPTKAMAAGIPSEDVQKLLAAIRAVDQGGFVTLAEVRDRLPWDREYADRVIARAWLDGVIALPQNEGRMVMGRVATAAELLAGFRDDLERGGGMMSTFIHIQVR